MIQHNLKQGSAEWHAYRRNHFNASDAPAMMGCSPYETRDQLLHRLHTGLTEEVSPELQKRFDNGHAFERLARPLAEEFIGQPLYPVVGSKGKLSASFDGLTMDESINYEHKTLNDALRAAMVDGATGADLPLMYRVQMEHQHMVSGSSRSLFMASKWRGEALVEERHCWYEPDAALAADVAAGWEQFEKDLAAYSPSSVVIENKPVPKLQEALPALRVNAKGEITDSNLDEWKAIALDRIQGINTVLETDEQFSDADADAKWLREVSAGMKQAAARVRADMQSVDQVLNTLEHLDRLATERAVDLEKRVKREKDARRENIVLTGRAAFQAHLAGLNEEVSPIVLQTAIPDFDAVVKNKRSLASIQDAVNTELARCKIAADTCAKDVREKRAWTKAAAEGYGFLFADLQLIIFKPLDDFKLIVTTRIANHKAAKAKEEEDTRERIAAEERARAEQQQRQRNEMALQQIQGIQQQAMIAVLGRAGVRKGGTIECIRDTLAETEAWVIDEENFGSLMGTAQSTKDRVVAEIREMLADREASAAAPVAQAEPIAVAATPAPAPVAAPAVVALKPRAAAPVPAPLSPPTLRLGVINERLLPCGLSTSAEGLRLLGFTPAAKDRAAVLFHERDWPHMLAAMVQRLESISATAAA
ncbi:hypothetical protein RD110_15790 [Rhodoferax koreense]|uniref:YqaJ viral recombinase domain-containing protein n=1 Tax=Rhodoferax koreensis TaxID=1842727 RepID=A0A1P8JXK5_9BURK|nr:YqaJ viral recombinase family protein [Rhodoferax koreense]APW38483.1 hypothetical protein RD110_15790 [Rhodoferax koreense]